MSALSCAQHLRFGSATNPGKRLTWFNEELSHSRICAMAHSDELRLLVNQLPYIHDRLKFPK
jgi:hypothetical protein